MTKFECPSCKQKSVSLWRKSMLNSTICDRCPNCGAWIGTTVLWNVVSFLPFFIYLILLWMGKLPSELETSAPIVAIIASMLIHLFVSAVQVEATREAADQRKQ